MNCLPAPWVLSILALLGAAMIARARAPYGARLFLGAALLSICAVTLLAGARLSGARGLWLATQPHIALLTAPSFWLGFHALSRARGWPAPRVLRRHGAGMALAQLGVAAPAAWSADAVVALVNGAYALGVAGLLRLDEDRFVHVPAAAQGGLRLAMSAVIGFLALVMMIDASVLLAGALAGEAGALRALSGASALLLGALLAGALIAIALGARPDPDASSHPSPVAGPEDRAILAEIAAVMAEARLYADPSLTLARLARRLGRPARSVSGSVNRGAGENVSRHVNGYRVRHAADLLARTALPVTEIMLESGFLSKSAFNAEFRRVMGVTPSAYRQSSRGA